MKTTICAIGLATAALALPAQAQQSLEHISGLGFTATEFVIVQFNDHDGVGSFVSLDVRNLSQNQIHVCT